MAQIYAGQYKYSDDDGQYIIHDKTQTQTVNTPNGYNIDDNGKSVCMTWLVYFYHL